MYRLAACMRYRFVLLITLVIAMIVVAQGPVAAQPLRQSEFDKVAAELAGKGYEVTAAGYIQNDDGTDDTSQCGVVMPTISQKYDSKLRTQVLDGFAALNHYLPQVPVYITELSWDKYLIIFGTENKAYTQYLKKQISLDTYWAYIEKNIVVYDTQAKQVVQSRDFLTKNFGNKDFSGNNDNNNNNNNTNDNNNNNNNNNNTNTSNTNTQTSNKAGYMTFLPSTLYIPTDKQDPQGLYVQLSDANRQPMDNETVKFTLKSTGSEPQDLGQATTNSSGVGRLSFSPTNLKEGSIELRAFTNSLSTIISVLTGPSPRANDNKGFTDIVVKALQAQGYVLIPDDSGPGVIIGGSSDEPAVYVQMQMASKRFDRSAYSQILLTSGTLITLRPNLDNVGIILEAENSGLYYFLIFQISPNDWKAWRSGGIDEITFWSRQMAPSVYECTDPAGNNCRKLTDKNFITKTFQGASGSNDTNTATTTYTRTVEASIVNESWGTQNYFGQIRIGPGATATNFQLTLTGNVTGWDISDIYDPSKKLASWKQGDDLNAAKDTLKKLQLASGTYFLVLYGQPDAKATLTYQETSAY